MNEIEHLYILNQHRQILFIFELLLEMPTFRGLIPFDEDHSLVVDHVHGFMFASYLIKKIISF